MESIFIHFARSHGKDLVPSATGFMFVGMFALVAFYLLETISLPTASEFAADYSYTVFLSTRNHQPMNRKETKRC